MVFMHFDLHFVASAAFQCKMLLLLLLHDTVKLQQVEDS